MFVVGAAHSDGVSSTQTSASGIAVAAAINAISGQSGVTATVQATKVAGASASGFATAITAGSVLINGVDIGALDAATSGAARGGQMTSAINAKSSQTGVVATFNKSTGAVDLTASDGRNIAISIVSAATPVATAAPNPEPNLASLYVTEKFSLRFVGIGKITTTVGSSFATARALSLE